MNNLPIGKKAFSVALVLIAIASVAVFSDSSTSSKTQSAAVYQATAQVSQPIVQPTAQPALSNNNYYVNSVGNTVHSPAYTNDNSVPAGASARCRDGSYSSSQHRSGTCSHHGGVATWF